MRAMVRSPTSILLHAALSKAVPFEQYLAHYAQATACGDSQINRGFERENQVSIAFSSIRKFANLVTSESKCRRITIRPWHGRYSLSGDSIKANTRRGVFRVNYGRRSRVSRATMSHARV